MEIELLKEAKGGRGDKVGFGIFGGGISWDRVRRDRREGPERDLGCLKVIVVVSLDTSSLQLDPITIMRAA